MNKQFLSFEETNDQRWMLNITETTQSMKVQVLQQKYIVSEYDDNNNVIDTWEEWRDFSDVVTFNSQA